MRSKSEHKIHHDHRHFWIARFFDQATDTVGRVNHWMRLAVGEVIIAKVEEGVFDAAVDILQAEFRIGLDIAVDIAVFFHHREHGFVTQRAAAEQATNVFLLRLQTHTHVSNQRLVQGMQVEMFLFHTGEHHRF